MNREIDTLLGLHKNGYKHDHHFQKTLEPHLNLSLPSHSNAKSSEINGTFCIYKNQEHDNLFN